MITRVITIILVAGCTGSTIGAQDGMLHLASTTGVVTVPNMPDLTPPSGLTVEAWYYFDPNLPGAAGTIVCKDPAAYVYRLRSNNSGFPSQLQWLVQIPGMALPTLLNTTIQTPPLSWHHVAGTYGGGFVRIFVDGFQINFAPHSGPLPVTTGPLLIGRGSNTNEVWNGSIDEVRIWSVARTAAQIQSTMFKRIDNHPGLIAAWHFDGNFFDLTGGHAGTATGGAVIAPSTSPVLSTYLEAPATCSIGSPLNLQVHALPGSSYFTEVSVLGIHPGTPIPAPGTGVFPLNEPFLYSLLNGVFQYTFVNFEGVTDSVGSAVATINVHPNPILIGLVASAAFVVIDASAPLMIGDISNPTQTLITP